MDLVEARSWWRGVDQDSWWLVLWTDEESAMALCLRAPQKYRWIEPGKTHPMPLRCFSDGSLEPM